MAESTKIFKLFFQNDEEDEPIVRKITLNEITIDNLLAKIQESKEIFGETVTVQYLDQDGDKVTVATTDELVNAITDQVSQFDISYRSFYHRQNLSQL